MVMRRARCARPRQERILQNRIIEAAGASAVRACPVLGRQRYGQLGIF